MCNSFTYTLSQILHCESGACEDIEKGFERPPLRRPGYTGAGQRTGDEDILRQIGGYYIGIRTYFMLRLDSILFRRVLERDIGLSLSDRFNHLSASSLSPIR